MTFYIACTLRPEAKDSYLCWTAGRDGVSTSFSQDTGTALNRRPFISPRHGPSPPWPQGHVATSTCWCSTTISRAMSLVVTECNFPQTWASTFKARRSSLCLESLDVDPDVVRPVWLVTHSSSYIFKVQPLWSASAQTSSPRHGIVPAWPRCMTVASSSVGLGHIRLDLDHHVKSLSWARTFTASPRPSLGFGSLDQDPDAVRPVWLVTHRSS